MRISRAGRRLRRARCARREPARARLPPAQPDARGCLPCWYGCGRRGAGERRKVRTRSPRALHVAERRDRLHEAAQLDDLHARIHRGEDLRPRLSAVDKDDGVPGAHGLVAGDDRVFVRATVHKTCDDVGNPHVLETVGTSVGRWPRGPWSGSRGRAGYAAFARRKSAGIVNAISLRSPISDQRVT